MKLKLLHPLTIIPRQVIDMQSAIKPVHV